ncbi:hypothetical protein L914_01231 [Phytophthora nicotianae]|nr:hypothetical protein L914_01231 [Phytophthora nicotianae]
MTHQKKPNPHQKKPNPNPHLQRNISMFLSKLIRTRT